MYNKEKFICNGKSLRDVRVIDGIEYLRVFKFETKREVLVRKDTLKRVSSKK